MKRLLLVLLFLAITAAAQQNSQSLGDVARQYRAGKKPPGKVVTNDDLSGGKTEPASVSEVGVAAEPEPEAKPEGAKAAPAAKAPAEESPAERDAGYRARYQEQKKQVDLLQRELNVLQRESQIQSADYYGDAGNMLRNSEQWFQKQKKYQDDVAAKQRALDEARQKLEDLQEEARRAGVSGRAVEE